VRTNKQHIDNPYKDSNLLIDDDALDVLKELSPTGLKIYIHIRENCFCDNEFIFIFIDEIHSAIGYKEIKSVYNGLNELLKLDILSRTKEKGAFYYNKGFFKTKTLLT